MLHISFLILGVGLLLPVPLDPVLIIRLPTFPTAIPQAQRMPCLTLQLPVGLPLVAHFRQTWQAISLKCLAGALLAVRPRCNLFANLTQGVRLGVHLALLPRRPGPLAVFVMGDPSRPRSRLHFPSLVPQLGEVGETVPPVTPWPLGTQNEAATPLVLFLNRKHLEI